MEAAVALKRAQLEEAQRTHSLEQEVADLDRKLAEKELQLATVYSQHEAHGVSTRDRARQILKRENVKDVISWKLRARGVSKDDITSHSESIHNAARAAVDRLNPGDSRSDSRISRIAAALDEAPEDEVVELVRRTIKPTSTRPRSATGLRAATTRRRNSCKASRSRAGGGKGADGRFTMPYDQAKAMFVDRMRGVVLQDREAARRLFQTHATKRSDGTRDDYLSVEQFAKFVEGLTGKSVARNDAERLVVALTGMSKCIKFEDFIYMVLGFPEGFFQQDLAKPSLPPRTKAQEMCMLPESTTAEAVKKAFAAKLRTKLFRVGAACCALCSAKNLSDTRNV